MEEKYSGDIILISRMIEYFPQKSFEWNANEPITLGDVQFAINHHLSEMAIPFGDTFKYPPKKRTSQWNIRRILYFVNHPQEIKNIELDNESSTFDILPVPIIIDGLKGVDYEVLEHTKDKYRVLMLNRKAISK